MQIELWMWAAFVGFILAMLALDLVVFHKDAHEVSFREAATWSAIWVALGLVVRRPDLVLAGARGGRASSSPAT